jgi:hypothetical protein
VLKFELLGVPGLRIHITPREFFYSEYFLVLFLLLTYVALWLDWSYSSLHMAIDNLRSRRGQIKSVLRFKNGKQPSPSRREYAARGMNLS